MNNLLKFALIILALVASLFLVGFLYWLYYCQCGGKFWPGHPASNDRPTAYSAPAASGTVEPHRTSGKKYPPFKPAKEQEFNDDRPRIVPSGPIRGSLAPTVQGSGLFKLEKDKQNPPLGGAGDPVVFTQYDPEGTIAAVGTPPDMNAARSGNVIMLSYNTEVLLSTNGGTNYTRLDPTTVFPSGITKDAAGNVLDNGLCCDQVIRYVPQIDRFVWLMQFCGSGTNCLLGINKVRIASASPQAIIDSGGTAWTYWDLTSGVFNLGNTTIDYPDLAVGDNFIYLSGDAVSQGLLVVRVPLNEIRDSLTINFNFTSPSNSSNAYGAHLTQNTGNTIFWAGHVDNSTLQVFSWAEGSNTYYWRSIAIDTWPNATISSIAPDGTDWLSFGFPGNAAIGATRRTAGEVWFAWTASSNSNFKNPHVVVVEINTTNFTKSKQWQIWNNDYAFTHPYLATNEKGEVGISLGWGGKTAGASNYGSNAVGILGDFIVWYPELSTASAVTTPVRYGDYFSVSRNPNSPSLFDGSGYAVLKRAAPATGWFIDPYYIQFGRNSVVNPAGGGSIN
ncbi:MAG: hypothetical protein U1E87_08110 [Alphaproteobacteria bacterium]